MQDEKDARIELLIGILVDTQKVLSEAVAMPSIMLGSAIRALIYDNNNIIMRSIGITPPGSNERAKI